MYTGKYNILLYIGTEIYRFNLNNVNFVYVNDLQDCLHELSIFSYDAILINIEADNKAICEIVRIIRSMTYVPVIVIAKISTGFILDKKSELLRRLRFFYNVVATRVWKLGAYSGSPGNPNYSTCQIKQKEQHKTQFCMPLSPVKSRHEGKWLHFITPCGGE